MGYSDRIHYAENNKVVCPDCHSKMIPKEIYENGILWKCKECGYERNEHYNDPERKAYESEQAWGN